MLIFLAKAKEQPFVISIYRTETEGPKSLLILRNNTPTIAPYAPQMPSPSTILSGLGVLLLFHSAYSALQYRSILLSAVDIPEHLNPDRPPLDAIVEVIAAFGLCLLGQLLSESFQGVRATTSSAGTKKGGRKAMSSTSAPAYKTRDFDLYRTTRKRI